MERGGETIFPHSRKAISLPACPPFPSQRRKNFQSQPSSLSFHCRPSYFVFFAMYPRSALGRRRQKTVLSLSVSLGGRPEPPTVAVLYTTCDIVCTLPTYLFHSTLHSPPFFFLATEERMCVRRRRRRTERESSLI